jgi:hypothetical protein
MIIGSVGDILKAIADSKSLNIFCSIATGIVEGNILKHGSGKGLSRKQYYSRTSQMLKAGLIKKEKGRLSLTSLGKIVYRSQLEIETGVKNFWKLRAIDSIQGSNEMDRQECANIIGPIIGDEKIEGILEKQIEVNVKR